MLTVETKRTTQEEEQRRAPGFDPVHTAGLSEEYFGFGAKAVKILFEINPFIFEGTNVANGTNMPNFKNVLLAQLLKEIGQGLQAGLHFAIPR